MAAALETLRYLDAECVRVSGQVAGGLEVRAADRQALGFVQAVLIEPASRRARYYVVESRWLFGTRRRLVPTDGLATVDTANGIIYIDVDRADVIESFDAASIPRFSDDDLIDTLFAPAA